MMLSNRQCNLIEIISSRGKLQLINHGNNKTRGNNNNNKPKKNQKKKNNKGVNKGYGRQKTWVRPKRTKDLD